MLDQYKYGNQYYEDSYDFEVLELRNQANLEIVFSSERSKKQSQIRNSKIFQHLKISS